VLIAIILTGLKDQTVICRLFYYYACFNFFRCHHQRPNIEKISQPRMLNKLYEVNSWSCNSCGNIVKGEHKFCPTCGNER
jgi:ABC-type ATPase with predicted acetyltransferase domain